MRVRRIVLAGLALVLLGAPVGAPAAAAEPVPGAERGTGTAEPARGDAPQWTRQSGSWGGHRQLAPVINVDYSQAPDLAAFGDQVKVLLEEWYPRINEMLPSEGYTPPQVVNVFFDPNYDGVAGVTDTTIIAGPDYFREHLDDFGAFVHEGVHVAQQYGANNVPGWLTEGVADYIRYYHYQPDDNPIVIEPGEHYTGGYGEAAFLLNYAQTTYDQEIVVKLNDAARRNVYTDELWVQFTGKTADALWAEAVATIPPPPAV